MQRFPKEFFELWESLEECPLSSEMFECMERKIFGKRSKVIFLYSSREIFNAINATYMKVLNFLKKKTLMRFSYTQERKKIPCFIQILFYM